MKKSLPARPNLEHLRTQAKQLLSDLRAGDAAAARTFIEHLPAAGRMTPEKVLRAGFRLADAQSAIARQSGFAAWPGLAGPPLLFHEQRFPCRRQRRHRAPRFLYRQEGH